MKEIIFIIILILLNGCSTRFKEIKNIDNNITKTQKGLEKQNNFLLKIGEYDINNKIILGSILFDYDSIKLNNNSKEFINKNISILNNTKIYLIGYSSEYNNTQYNLVLSLKRLNKVKEYLIKNKFPFNNIETKVINIDNFHCLNKNLKNCLIQNRKVEFYID
jgi:outer membrane protein OmpA-like peptidoglycan-associated protein